MSFYTGIPNWINSIYILDVPDKIEYGLTGKDSLPNIDLSNQKSYLKKFKGLIINGNNDPSGNMSLTEIDINMETNLMYLDNLTANFWKPIVIGTNISSWINITKNVVLNIKEIRLNGDTDDTTYVKLKFNDEGTLGENLDVVNKNDKPTDIKSNRFIFDSGEGYSFRQTYTPDNEVLINSDIETEIQNSDSSFGVKRYDSVTGGDVIDNAWFKWDESLQRWELVTEQDNLLYLNVSSIFQNGKQANFLPDELITNQTEFDNIFNTDIDGGTTTFDNSTGEPNYIYIKPGEYILRNYISIERSDFIIECSIGTTIKLHSSIATP